MRLVLLGPPGAGKGTLANLLKEAFGMQHISTGDILRDEMKNNTPLGQEAKKYIEEGDLVPEDIVTKLIESKLSKNKTNETGYMFDGFPRTKKQAEDLDKLLNDLNSPLEYAIFLEVSEPTIIQRLTGRRVCKKCDALYHVINKPSKQDGICDLCNGELYQRVDDNEETIKTRLDVYMKNTMPIVDYYETQKKLRRIDGNKDSADVKEILIGIFDEDPK